jgi:hypothetical protein
MLDINVWIAIAVVTGVVVALAVWLGRGLIIKKDKEGYSVQVEKDLKPDSRTDTIRVAEALEIKDAEAGDIAGKKVTSPDAISDRAENIDVLSHGKIERTKLGDIVGIKQENRPPPDGEKKE